MEAKTMQNEIKMLAEHAPQAYMVLSGWKEICGSSTVAKQSGTPFMVVMESFEFPMKVFAFCKSYNDAANVFYHTRKAVLNDKKYSDIRIKTDENERLTFEARLSPRTKLVKLDVKIIDIPYYMEGLEAGNTFAPYKREYY